MSEAEVRALFLLAGIPVERVWRLENCYWSPGHTVQSSGDDAERLRYLTLAAESPWWLAKTAVGLIEIGWRKRVIAINWSDTGLRVVVTPDDVTKGPTMVHAWSEAKAVEYLANLRAAFATGAVVHDMERRT